MGSEVDDDYVRKSIYGLKKDLYLLILINM